MITFNHIGDLSKSTKALVRMSAIVRRGILHKYGQLGVATLALMTPLDTGRTAGSWDYKIETASGRSSISFSNSNVNKGVNIAIILQYGHGTGTGGWVQGRDYINPAIQPVFDKITEDLWKEVTST